MSNKARVSAANLATRLIMEAPGEVNVYDFGIMPKKRIQALGGAAELTPAGVEFLTQQFDASAFEIDNNTGNADARFQVG